MKIWATYTSENTEDRPVENTVDTSVLHRELTYRARLESSPELYSLKKFGGRLIMRIIVAD